MGECRLPLACWQMQPCQWAFCACSAGAAPVAWLLRTYAAVSDDHLHAVVVQLCCSCRARQQNGCSVEPLQAESTRPDMVMTEICCLKDVIRL